MRTLPLALLAALTLWPARSFAQPRDERRDERREEQEERREEKRARRAQQQQQERRQRPPKARPAPKAKAAPKPKPKPQPRRPPAGVPAPVVRPPVVPAPQPVRDVRHILRDRRGPPAPPLDEAGRPVTPAPTTAAPNHALIEARRPVVRVIQERERDEHVRGRYYWHHEGGVRYCHYFDAWGAHWYGFYAGPRFYWTRRWYNRWWWYDPVGARWVYWHSGYWWWQDPLAPGALYVYMDGNYVPYGSLVSYAGGPAASVPLTPNPPPQQVQASTAPVQLYYSDDGSRMAQIVGDDRGAYLYDSSVSGTPSFLAELSTGASSVRFSSSPVSQILVQRLDGTWALFDGDGKPQ